MALLLGLAACELALGLCVQEDAFISFRYARNLVEGHGLVFNPGERVEGYTNFLWVLLTAAVMKAGGDPVPFARWAGAAVSLALVVLVWRAARRRDAPRGRTGGLIAAAVVACSTSVAVEAVQGLETVPFAFLVTAGVLAGIAAREGPAGRPGGAGPGAAAPAAAAKSAAAPRTRPLLGAALLLVLAALTRPEGVGVFGLAALAAALWRRRRGGALLTRPEAAAMVLFAVLYGAYWLWRFDYYGYPLPNTFYAKTGGGLRHAVRGLVYIGTFLLLNPVVAALTAWAAARARADRGAGARAVAGDADAAAAGPAAGTAGRAAAAGPSLLSWTAACVVVGYLAYVASVGGDFKKTFRFVIPVLPLWAVWLDDAVSRRGWPRLARPRPRRREAAAWLALGAIALNGLVGLPTTVRWARVRGWDLQRRAAAGRWLAAHARPGDVLAIRAAGIIPYYSGLPTLDILGLTDVHIAHRKVPGMGSFERKIGHEKEDLPYVLARRPTYYVDEFLYVTGEPVPDLRRRLLDRPALREVGDLYEARSVELTLDPGDGPRPHWFNFLELRR